MRRKDNRNLRINVRLSQTEYDDLQKIYKKSTNENFTGFIRSIALNKPVIVKTRNQSMDDFLADMIGLRKDLNDISDNFSKSVRRLNELNRASDIQHWILLNEQDKTRIFRLIEAISNRVNEIYQQCFPK